MYNGRAKDKGEFTEISKRKMEPVSELFYDLREDLATGGYSRYTKVYVKNWDILQDKLRAIAGKDVTIKIYKVKTGEVIDKKVKVPVNIVATGLMIYMQFYLYQQFKAPSHSHESFTECAFYWSDEKVREVTGITNHTQMTRIIDSLIYTGAIVRKVGMYNGKFKNYYFVNPMLDFDHDIMSEQV